MAEGRVFNFSAGPSQMPLEVLETIQSGMLNYRGCGMSILEMSHRSKEFVAISAGAEKDLRDILDVPADHKVLFTQGSATLQFSAVPLNMLGGKAKADFLVTGQWGEKAYRECQKYGIANLACNTKPTLFTSIPEKRDWNLDAEAAFVHYCANETITGVEWQSTPDVGAVPLVSDMSSNFLSKPIDVKNHAVIYAGLHKNAGPPGMAVSIIKDEFCSGKSELKSCPSYCSWRLAADHHSMYNTPNSFAIYAMGEYLKYTKRVGGVAHWAEMSENKSRMIYDVIDNSDGFYCTDVNKDVRSKMNIPFTILGGDEALQQRFFEEAKKDKLYALAGHQSVGGCRVSLYNGIPMEGVDKLAAFMKSFEDENREYDNSSSSFRCGMAN